MLIIYLNWFSDFQRTIELVIRKVSKTQHQNPEFGRTQGEKKKKLQNNTLAFKRGMKRRKP